MKKTDALTPFESWVIEQKGTEAPFTGVYTDHFEKGTYCCRKCDAPLYQSNDKFHSSCGWPSFDGEVSGNVKRTTDADGRRVEITCEKCGAHLGHVFEGEGFTAKNTRHCVNSVSMVFKPSLSGNERVAIFASGCFWGTEFHFAKVPGVLKSEVGYCGGHVDHPTYEQVCTGKTGHIECVAVTWDPKVTNYETLVKLYFETHDFSQEDGQGPDIGSQYISVVFVQNDEERKILEKVISELKQRGFKVATQIRAAEKFWSAEDYHQKYYFRHAKTPYCHVYKKIF